MTISRKMKRGIAIAAAVIMLVTLLFSTVSQVISLVSVSRNFDAVSIVSTLTNLGINAVCSILLIVILFRGKKDTLAGILAIVTALPVVFSGVIGNMVSAFAYTSAQNGIYVCLMAAAVVRVLGNVANAVFRVFLAVECFKPGSFSGSKRKSWLILLPMLYVLLMAVATMVQNLYMVSDYGFGRYITAALMPAVFGLIPNIPYVLLGLAVSVPVYEEKSVDNAFEASGHSAV